jgi:hypothetical protein
MGYSEGYLQYGKSYFKISENERLWFPHLTPNKNWKNTVSDDWSTIYEENIGDNHEEQVQPKSQDDNIKKYTFAKYKNNLGETSYRFIGVFKFKKRKKLTTIYERISDEIETMRG